MKAGPLIVLSTCLLVGVVAICQDQKPLTNDDVSQMVQAGFDEETIIKAIQANEPAFDTSVQALIALKNAGVSEKVIAAMLEAKKEKADPTPASDVAPRPAIVESVASDGGPPVIYVEEVSSEGTISASSDTALEAMKTLQKKGMRLVTIKEKADYILQITRQLGQKSWSKDTKVVLSNRAGEVVYANSTRSVGGAMGDVEEYIKKHHE